MKEKRKKEGLGNIWISPLAVNFVSSFPPIYTTVFTIKALGKINNNFIGLRLKEWLNTYVQM